MTEVKNKRHKTTRCGRQKWGFVSGNGKCSNVHDSKAALLLMMTLRYLLIPLEVILADGGYRGEIIEEIKIKFNYIIQIVMRSDKKVKEFEPIRKRWVIERTFPWFDNDRKLCRKPNEVVRRSKIMNF